MRFERSKLLAELNESRNELATAKAEMATIKQRLIEYRDYVGADGGPEKLRGIQSCIEYALTKTELAKLQGEAKGEEWRELTKDDQYSGPGQVRDCEEQEWIDGDVIAVVQDEYSFISKTYGVYPLGYKFARVRKTSGKGIETTSTKANQ
jgi:hypothetical protein